MTSLGTESHYFNWTISVVLCLINTVVLLLPTIYKPTTHHTELVDWQYLAWDIMRDHTTKYISGCNPTPYPDTAHTFTLSLIHVFLSN